MRAGAGPGGLRAVALVSFAESALLPLPVDAVTLPVMLADRRQIRPVVLWATITSVLGGALGYLIGFAFFETVGRWLIEFYGWQDGFAALKVRFLDQGVLIVLIGALTPIPFKLIAIFSGLQGLDFWLFLGVSFAGRLVRFAAFGLLVWYLGDGVRSFLERHASLAGWAMLALLVGGFAAMAWL